MGSSIPTQRQSYTALLITASLSKTIVLSLIQEISIA